MAIRLRVWLYLFLLFGSMTCASIQEDPSQFAMAAGQHTAVIGASCSDDLKLGFSSCALIRGQAIPELRLYFMNAAQYRVGDCDLQGFAQGSVDQAGEVVIPLAPLKAQLERNGFCILKIEAIEFYPDPRDPVQKRQVPFAGGFFIETFEPGYFPTPPDSAVSWCFKISGSNKGRRKIEACQ